MHDISKSQPGSYNIPIVLNIHCGTEQTPPPPWFDHYQGHGGRSGNKYLKTIYRDNRISKCVNLPVISVSNLRSLWPKVRAYCADLAEREISLSILSEVWQRKGNKKHNSEIERMLEMCGLKYISTPRPSSKRGGGCAIVADVTKYTLEKIEVSIPSAVEVVYGLLRPREVKIVAGVKVFIVVAFYSPPKSRKKTILADHIVTTCQTLLTKYPNAGLIIGGDRNEMSVSPLIFGLPKLHQINQNSTCYGKVLDVLLTNLYDLYQVPKVVPPVNPDDPSQGVPSDHWTVVAKPLLNGSSNITNIYHTKTFRPLPESGVAKFGAWLESENWSNFCDDTSPDNQVQQVQDLLHKNLNECLPQKTGRFTSKDKPYITCELKKLDKKKKKEYSKHGCSAKFKDMKEEFDKKILNAARNHLDKNVTMLMESEPGKAYITLKKMGAKAGDNLEDGSFTLLEHLEANLTNKESVDRIASHFSKVSQEYPALDVTNLPQSIKVKLNSSDLLKNAPQLSESDVHRLILKAKKPKAGIPGDLPRRLVQRFARKLARPYTQIYNKIVQTGQWPSVWKVEHGLPLKKCTNPINEDDIRVISLTAFFSKVFEKFVMEWLLYYIGDKIDKCQYGGEKGSGVAHYLIDFINFVQYNQDLKDIHAVLAVAVDFKKAFNRQNHYTLVKLLSDMGVPGWLLAIVIGFLKNRELLVNFKGETSEKQKMPGGGPQGTLLGLFLFLVLINAAGFEDVQKNTGKLITKPFNKRPAIEKIHMKYIDDMMAAEALFLKEKLVNISDPVRPLEYHKRTLHMLPPSKCKMQSMMDELVQYANKHDMVINQHKTKAFLFNQAKKFAFNQKF